MGRPYLIMSSCGSRDALTYRLGLEAGLLLVSLLYIDGINLVILGLNVHSLISSNFL
jgi:hypothetical protein